MRRLIPLLACLTLLIALPAAAHNDDTPVWEMVDAHDALYFFGWSPDGQWIAYFTNEADEFSDGPAPTTADFHWRNLATGESCIYPDIPLGGRYTGLGVYAWLPDHRWLSMANGAQITTPCADDVQDLTAPQPIYGINSVSPDGTKVLFSGDNAYTLYDLVSDEFHPVTGIVPNNVDHSPLMELSAAWSPDSTQIAAIVNSYGSVYLIDAATGESTLLLDEPLPTQNSYGEGYDPKLRYAKRAAQIDLPYPQNPVWLTRDLFFLRYNRIHGALILSTSGQIVREDGDQMIINVAPYGTDAYRVQMRQGDQRLIYYSETDTTETVALGEWGGGGFTPDGRLLLLQAIPEGAYTKRQDYLIGVKPVSVPGLPIVRRLVVNRQPIGTAWSPDGARVAVGIDGSNNLVVLDGEDFGDQQWVIFPNLEYVRARAWSPDGTQIAATAYDRQHQQADLLIVTPR